MRHAIVVPVAAFALLVSGLVFAESLGEVAAREKEKKKNAKPTKVITQDDLGRSGSHGTFSTPEGSAAPAPDPAAAPAKTDPSAPKDPNAPAAAPKEKTADELRAEQEKAWRDRRDQKAAEVANLEASVSRLEGRRTLYLDATGQADLDKAKADLAAARAALASLEDERRRAGIKQ